MADVVLYTLSTCPFCIRAKRLLDGRNVAYREVVVDADPEARREVLDEARARDPRRVQQRLDGGERAHPDDAVCARRFFCEPPKRARVCYFASAL